MSRYVLDPTAYAEFMHGDAHLVELVDQAEWIGMPLVTVGVLRAGFLLGTRAAQGKSELLEFLSHPIVETIPVDHDVSRYFAEIVVELRRAGVTLPTHDVWIAACAARTGSVVLTYRDHFRQITRVGSLVLGS